MGPLMKRPFSLAAYAEEAGFQEEGGMTWVMKEREENRPSLL
jgi:hypothetical protein